MSDFNKLKWETSNPANAGKTSKKDVDYSGKSGKQPPKTCGDSGQTPVVRGGSGDKTCRAPRIGFSRHELFSETTNCSRIPLITKWYLDGPLTNSRMTWSMDDVSLCRPID